MKSFSVWLAESDYCSGLSINADLFWEVPVPFLQVLGKDTLVAALKQAVVSSNMKIFDERLTKYSPNPEHGFSYLIVLGQSHMMIHTWPEEKMMNLDIFTCGNEGNPQRALESLKMQLKPAHVQFREVKRGIRKDIKSTSENPM